MIKSLLLLFCLCSYTQSFSQEIHFKTKVTASPYVYIDRDTVEIKVFKYYITKLQLWKQQQLVYTDKRGAFLIDGLSDATYYLANKKNYDSLSFTLGIDSAIQRKGALGKDLDPTNGLSTSAFADANCCNTSIVKRFTKSCRPARKPLLFLLLLHNPFL